MPGQDLQDSNIENGDVFSTADHEAEVPERPLLKPSLVILVFGFAIALSFGVLATSSPPNSTGERLGSTMQRVGIFTMLLAFCGILFAYRYSFLKRVFLRLAASEWMRPWLFLLPSMLGFLLFHWVLLLTLRGLFADISNISAAILVIQASICAVMVRMHLGPIQGFAIGYLAAFLTSAFWIDGIVLSSLFARSSPLMRGFETSVWSVLYFHSFLIFTGFLAAGYVSLLLFVGNKTGKSETGEVGEVNKSG